jgi:ribosomal protein L7/L12
LAVPPPDFKRGKGNLDKFQITDKKGYRMLQVESELTKFEVTLVRPGHDKINCIKAIRGCTNLGLREAKALADTVPQVLGKCTREYAESLRSEFNEVGATITGLPAEVDSSMEVEVPEKEEIRET